MSEQHQLDKNVEQLFEEGETVNYFDSDMYDDQYAEYDDFEDEPHFEKTNRQKGLTKFRW